jgi:hypothetical protein
MLQIPINWWAVVVAAVVKFLLGALWYSPLLFLRSWQREAGVDDNAMRTRLPLAVPADALGSLIMAVVLVHAVRYAGVRGWGQGAALGFFAWLGFIAVTQVPATIYEGRSWRFFAINAGYLLVALLLMGAILAAWPASGGVGGALGHDLLAAPACARRGLHASLRRASGRPCSA